MIKKVNAVQTIDTSNLVKKAEYKTKIYEIKNKIPNHDEYITTQEFNKLMTENFATRLKKVILASKDDIDDFVKRQVWWKANNINRKLLQIKQEEAKKTKWLYNFLHKTNK